jgi:hypothetical protein
MNRFSMLRVVPHALNLMSSDIDLWQPVPQEMLSDHPLVVRVRGFSSRQNTSKMGIRVRKVLLNGKSNSNLACKYMYIPIFLDNSCRERWVDSQNLRVNNV